MSFEVGSVGCEGCEEYVVDDAFESKKPIGDFHKAISDHSIDSDRLMRRSVRVHVVPGIAQRVDESARKIKLLKVEADAEVKLTASWDDNGFVDVTAGISGSVWDDHGNYAKGEIERKSDGSGSASVSAGHKSEDR